MSKDQDTNDMKQNDKHIPYTHNYIDNIHDENSNSAYMYAGLEYREKEKNMYHNNNAVYYQPNIPNGWKNSYNDKYKNETDSYYYNFKRSEHDGQSYSRQKSFYDYEDNSNKNNIKNRSTYSNHHIDDDIYYKRHVQRETTNQNSTFNPSSDLMTKKHNQDDYEYQTQFDYHNKHSFYKDSESKYIFTRNMYDIGETLISDKSKFIGGQKNKKTMKRQLSNQSIEGLAETKENISLDETPPKKLYNEEDSVSTMNLHNDYTKKFNNSNFRETRPNDEKFSKNDIDERYIGGSTTPYENQSYNMNNNNFNNNPYTSNTMRNTNSSINNNSGNNYHMFDQPSQIKTINSDYQYQNMHHPNNRPQRNENDSSYITPQQYYDQDYPPFGYDNMNDQPLYVNVKQYSHIRKRKHRRDFLDSMMQAQENSGYLHESRHKHAMNRMRAPSGRFLTKEETAAMKRKMMEEESKENAENITENEENSSL